MALANPWGPTGLKNVKSFLLGGGLALDKQSNTLSAIAPVSGSMTAPIGTTGGTVTSVGVTTSSLALGGTNPVTLSGNITADLPTVGNLTVLGIGSGGNATAKPITLVAGSGVSLTGAAGNITIAATGGNATGNVSGPGSSGNGTAALFNGTTGQLIEDSKVFVTIPAGNATLTIDSGFTLHVTANATVSGTNTGDISSANPTATASDTAVNGVATTYMRSDAAPAVQKASSSVFGLVKVDGTTITATGGVISAPGGGGALTLAYTNAPTGSTGNATSITSTAISGGTHLFIVFMGRGNNASTTVQVLVRFNGDSGSVYNEQIGVFSGSGAPSAAQSIGGSSMRMGDIAGASATANHCGMVSMVVGGYAQTTFDKPLFSGSIVSSGAGINAEMASGHYGNTSAIGNVTVLLSAGNITNGSILSVYTMA